MGSTSGTTNTDNQTASFVNLGSEAKAIGSKSSSYSLADTDNIIVVTATGQTMTLPDASAHCLGRVYTIVYTAASGSCTVATTSSQTITTTAGSTTSYSLSAQGKRLSVVSNGANWICIENN